MESVRRDVERKGEDRENKTTAAFGIVGLEHAAAEVENEQPDGESRSAGRVALAIRDDSRLSDRRATMREARGICDSKVSCG